MTVPLRADWRAGEPAAGWPLAVGPPAEVEELVRVRLGIKQDLKITGNFFERFQALDQGTAVRLIANDPPSVGRYFSPIFTRELLEATQIFGLGLTLDNLEGMTLGPRLPDGRQSVLLVSDNNFTAGQASQVLLLALG